MLTFIAGPYHTLVQSECEVEDILGRLSLVTIKLLTDDVQRQVDEFLDAPCSFTLGYP